MKKDYSEYKPNSQELYAAQRRGGKELHLATFHNHVSLSPAEKTIVLRVDSGMEEYAMEDALLVLDQLDQEKRGIPKHVPSAEELAFDEERRIEKLERNRRYAAQLQSRYRIRVSPDEEFTGSYCDDDGKEMPLNNVLSGEVIDLRYGEGILDFVYADFETPFQKAIQMPLLFESLAEAYQKQHPEVAEREKTASKVYLEEQLMAEDYLDYTLTITHVREICYASLYTAICPPTFKQCNVVARPLRQYYKYLMSLQQEYRELLEFCFDDDFYPEVLGHMMPSERFCLYKSLHDHPQVLRRHETFRMRMAAMSGSKMPYGMDGDGLKKRFGMQIVPGDQHREFAERYNIDVNKLITRTQIPTFINVGYVFCTTQEILELEFTKMLEMDMRFRKCQRCGRYFIMKGNYDTKFCDRVAEGETRSCQELAAQERYKQKVADNAALPIYSKYYKRYAARVKVRQIKEADFKKWKFQALVKRDECTNGIITVEEFVEWLEGCFPNRGKK